MRCTNWSSHRLRSLTGSLALYSSLVSSVLKKLLTLGWPARSTWRSLPSLRTLHRPQTRISGLAPSSLVGSSITVENTLASVFESTPVHGDLPPRWGAVKFLPPEVSNRFLIPSKSKKKASLRLPAKKVYSFDLTMLGLAPKDTSASAMIFVPTASAERDSAPFATNTFAVCLPFCGGENT